MAIQRRSPSAAPSTSETKPNVNFRERQLLCSTNKMFFVLCSAIWLVFSQDTLNPVVQAFSITTVPTRSKFSSALNVASSTSSGSNIAQSDNSDENEEEEDDEEYEYLEYERLSEEEFIKSEWLVGTNFDKSSDKIEETWVRLVVDDDGKNTAYWGDNAQGKWSLDAASQFLAISKENLLGKKIWAGVVDDYYFMQGTVRGWTYWQSASVLGQWQAKRLGVDKDEAGTPPWFEEEGNEEEASESEKSSD